MQDMDHFRTIVPGGQFMKLRTDCIWNAVKCLSIVVRYFFCSNWSKLSEAMIYVVNTSVPSEQRLSFLRKKSSKKAVEVETQFFYLDHHCTDSLFTWKDVRNSFSLLFIGNLFNYIVGVFIVSMHSFFFSVLSLPSYHVANN